MGTAATLVLAPDLEAPRAEPVLAVARSGGRTRARRSPEEVLHDHLRLRAAGEAEEDIATNYAEDVVVVDRHEIRHGHEGVRDAVAALAEHLPDARFEYVTTHIAGEIGYLEWCAEADGRHVQYGADSFVIRDGVIQAQTLYYRVQNGSTRPRRQGA
jgi:hypothetical protein